MKDILDNTLPSRPHVPHPKGAAGAYMFHLWTWETLQPKFTLWVLKSSIHRSFRELNSYAGICAPKDILNQPDHESSKEPIQKQAQRLPNHGVSQGPA